MFPPLLRRTAALPLLVALLALAAFLALRLVPGSPYVQPNPIPEISRELELRLQVHRGPAGQFAAWSWCLLDGSLPSMRRPDLDLGDLLVDSLPVSATLGGLALLFALLLGMPAGLLAALRKDGCWDRLLRFGAALGISLPDFVLGPLLVLVFSLGLSWLPPARWDGPASLVLPVLTLGLPHAARVARLLRASTLEVLSADFVRTARSKGLPESRVLLVHVLPGALVPLFAYLGPTVAGIVTSTAIVEQIFQLPGLGYFFVQAALDRDYTMLLALVTFSGAVLLLVNLLADLGTALLDPRIRQP